MRVMTHVRNRSVCLFAPAVYCSQILYVLFYAMFISPGLISSSDSSDGDDSDPESSNSGDSAFSEDTNKMVESTLNPFLILKKIYTCKIKSD